MATATGVLSLNLSGRVDLHEADMDPLIARCRKGDPEAFGQFVDLYQARVFGFVRRMVGDVGAAEDIAQETFIRAFQSFGRFDGRSSPRTWLFRIAHNLCIDRARRKAHRVAEAPFVMGGPDAEELEVADERYTPERMILSQELNEAVEAAISTMSDKLRTVFLLADREEMPYDEISEMVGIPVGTVKSRLFLARAHLQKALTPYLEDR